MFACLVLCCLPRYLYVRQCYNLGRTYVPHRGPRSTAKRSRQLGRKLLYVLSFSRPVWASTDYEPGIIINIMMKNEESPPGSHQERGGRYRDSDEDGVDELGVACPPHTTEKKLMARIDAHLLPFISLLYLLAFLDRVNIANAKSFGLVTDLHLDAGGVQYNTILTIFFVPCKSSCFLVPKHTAKTTAEVFFSFSLLLLLNPPPLPTKRAEIDT